MEDVLKMHKLQPGTSCPVMVTRIPTPILKEIDEWVKESKRIKNHPLADLKAHENVGYRNVGGGEAYNSYQCSISRKLVEDSFWLPWVLRLSQKYWGPGLLHRNFLLRQWNGHFDGYDIWTNFAYKGDQNPQHNHAGFLSGVIYYKNHKHPTIFDQYDCAYEGRDGTMVLFPSQVLHHVEPQTGDTERITLAFNIMKVNELDSDSWMSKNG